MLVGFLGTVIHHPVERIFGNVWLTLTIPQQDITLSTLVWCWGINIYLSLSWRAIYVLTGEVFCLWVSVCYLFAIPEFYIVWDKPFWFLGIPWGSNALIAFGFIYYYGKRWMNS